MLRLPRAVVWLVCVQWACQDAIVPAPPNSDLSGEWDYELVTPGDEAVPCVTRGALVVAQSGSPLSGTLGAYVTNCGVPAMDTVSSWTLAADSLTFRAGPCTFGGRMVTADSLAGRADCGWRAGTWSASRVGAPQHLALDPQNRALAVGGAQTWTATLFDAAGHVLYGRAINWASSDPGVAIAAPQGARAVVTAVAPGVSLISATAAARTASATVTVAAALFESVAPGAYHTCALSSAGSAWCWGANASGQLGDGSTITSNAPVPVLGGQSFAVLSAGSGFTCALTSAGVAWCWGANFAGQLGTGDTLAATAPRAVLTTQRFVRIAAGTYHVCALTAPGDAWCWGENAKGQLGTGTRVSSRVPALVQGGLTFSAIGVGAQHSCAVAAFAAAWCWGENANGQLGIGVAATGGVTAPSAVVGGITFASVGGGRLHSCGLSTGGAAYCWGDGVYGQIGNGSRNTALAPALVAGGRTYDELSVGSEHSSARTMAGQVFGWGSNSTGESGDSTRSEWDVPALVPGGLVFTTVAAGGMHSCGMAGGTAYCWGYNSNGQIGDGTRTDRRAPSRVLGRP
jgi:alpha-tubulin suppressor-like RCC1 family protein